jgi:hypothetical protein
MTRPAPKPIRRVRSTAIRSGARDFHCTLRWADDCNGTAVLCHIRQTKTGGVGLKPSDLAGVLGCPACNSAMDSANRPPAEEVLRAMIESHALMLEAGLITVKGDR